MYNMNSLLTSTVHLLAHLQVNTCVNSASCTNKLLSCADCLQAICRYYRPTFLAAAAAAQRSILNRLLCHYISLRRAATGLYVYQVPCVHHS